MCIKKKKCLLREWYFTGTLSCGEDKRNCSFRERSVTVSCIEKRNCLLREYGAFPFRKYRSSGRLKPSFPRLTLKAVSTHTK
jgi:hypothetical protein